MRRWLCLCGVLALLAGVIPVGEAASVDAKAGAVTTASGGLKVRSAPSTSASVVTTLKKGSYITLMSKSGSWWKVEYGKERFGYCHGDYITIVQGTPVTVVTTGGNLNVRSGAGTQYAKVGSLGYGETVLLLTSSGGWSRVLYHGTKTGYVSDGFLSGGYGAVALKVPGYRQTDSRWADVTIGQSGKTLGQIGCATTAIAMMESYRLGKMLYPDEMVQTLRYTDTGNVYWPSHYQAVTRESGYLQAIYQKLTQGKPVLLGCRNASGAQHWVVVTGFTGGRELTASQFTIQDPGTAYRTNLQEFLESFPHFYKYFYY